ncbi:MAG: type II secretion system protein, partial [Planctomycetes bacterium]|nr:type II secretion system protein [Planctomycetota bacterium]
MNCLFNNNISVSRRPGRAFTLAEVVMAIALVATITSSVLVVTARCIDAAIDSTLKAQAFELARENMETLLAASSVTEVAEFGTDEKNPDMQWETRVETFNEPATGKAWAQAVCSASYTDAHGLFQQIELVHWLTDVSEGQMKLIQDNKRREDDYLEQLALEEDPERARDKEIIAKYLESLERNPEGYSQFMERLEERRKQYLAEYRFEEYYYYEFLEELKEKEQAFVDTLGIDWDAFAMFRDKYIEENPIEPEYGDEYGDEFEYGDEQTPYDTQPEYGDQTPAFSDKDGDQAPPLSDEDGDQAPPLSNEDGDQAPPLSNE